MADNSSFSHHQSLPPDLFDDYDHWILGRLHQVTADLEKCFANFEISPLTHQIYAFFWGDFCDWYVEASKGKLKASEELRDNCSRFKTLLFARYCNWPTLSFRISLRNFGRAWAMEK